MGGNGSGGGVGVGVGLGGAGLGGDGVSCMIQSRFMSSEVETSLTLFLTWRDKQSEIPLCSLAASLAVKPPVRLGPFYVAHPTRSIAGIIAAGQPADPLFGAAVGK